MIAWLILSLMAGQALVIRGLWKRVSALETSNRELQNFRAVVLNGTRPADDPRRQTSLGL